jgi:hypothetical protein
MNQKIEKPWQHGTLKVTANRRYLQNGSVHFFWLGDTAWLLLIKLDEKRTEDYLRNRSCKGFNVIQVVLTHDLGSCLTWGGKSVKPEDFTDPGRHTTFWERVDRLVKTAEELGIYLALLPVWGSMVKKGLLNESNAANYASFLANRYKNFPNIIWLLGGDIRGDANYNVWNIMGETLKNIYPDILIGYHPFGRTSSSQWFHNCAWLDFNMFQSGHRRYDQGVLGMWDDQKHQWNGQKLQEVYFGEDNWRYVLQDHSLSPLKPTIDGEPSYEEILQGLHDLTQPYWQDCDVRRYAYWSVFAGAFGHTYGHNAVMQFFGENEKNGAYGVKNAWQQALHAPGSSQMGHLKKLMISLPYATGLPDESLLASKQREEYARTATFRGNGFALFYKYIDTPFAMDLSKLGFADVQAGWFDPVSGVYSYIGNYRNGGLTGFIPAHRTTGQSDWVLVLTDEKYKYRI